MRLNPLEKIDSTYDIKFGEFKRLVQKLIYLLDPTQEHF